MFKCSSPTIHHCLPPAFHKQYCARQKGLSFVNRERSKIKLIYKDKTLPVQIVLGSPGLWLVTEKDQCLSAVCKSMATL